MINCGWICLCNGSYNWFLVCCGKQKVSSNFVALHLITCLCHAVRDFSGYFFQLFILLFYLRYNLKKLTYEERKAKLIERLNALNAAAGADEDDDEDDE